MSIPIEENMTFEEWEDPTTGLTWTINTFGKHDMNSAEGLADELLEWRLPTVSDWKTLVKHDMTWRDDVPFMDSDIYWTGTPYIHNIDQKSMVVDFSHKGLEIIVVSRPNPQTVRLVRN